MRLSDEVLMAYADGELEDELREQVQRAIASDPEIARRVSEHVALRRSVHGAFVGILKEPVPARLVGAALRASATASSPPVSNDHAPSNIVALRPKGRARPSMAQWAALAASFLLGVGFWQLIRPNRGAMIAEQGGELVATGALAQALSDQLVHEQTFQSPVQIGVSFRSKTGSYCRTFQMQPYSYAGMACRAGERWQVQMLGQNESTGTHAGGYRQAASAVPAWLARQVDNIIAGETLGAQAEANAQAHGWH